MAKATTTYGGQISVSGDSEQHRPSGTSGLISLFGDSKDNAVVERRNNLSQIAKLYGSVEEGCSKSPKFTEKLRDRWSDVRNSEIK